MIVPVPHYFLPQSHQRLITQLQLKVHILDSQSLQQLLSQQHMLLYCLTLLLKLSQVIHHYVLLLQINHFLVLFTQLHQLLTQTVHRLEKTSTVRLNQRLLKQSCYLRLAYLKIQSVLQSQSKVQQLLFLKTSKVVVNLQKWLVQVIQQVV